MASGYTFALLLKAGSLKMNKQELQQQAKELYEFFDSRDQGYYDHKRLFEVNVKRYNDYTDIADLLNKYPKQYH